MTTGAIAMFEAGSRRALTVRLAFLRFEPFFRGSNDCTLPILPGGETNSLTGGALSFLAAFDHRVADDGRPHRGQAGIHAGIHAGDPGAAIPAEAA